MYTTVTPEHGSSKLSVSKGFRKASRRLNYHNKQTHFKVVNASNDSMELGTSLSRISFTMIIVCVLRPPFKTSLFVPTVTFIFFCAIKNIHYFYYPPPPKKKKHTHKKNPTHTQLFLRLDYGYCCVIRH